MHVPTEETLPSTNVHFGNPVADRQAPPTTQTPFTPHAGVTIASLELYTWTYTSGPSSTSIWTRRDIWRRASCGDVKLPDRQLPNTSMTGKPGDNRPYSSQHASSMNRRLRSPLNPPSFPCPRVPLRRPHLVTCKTRHHTRWPGRYRV